MIATAGRATLRGWPIDEGGCGWSKARISIHSGATT